MPEEKNRGFKIRHLTLQVVCATLTIVSLSGPSCERRAHEPMVMVASSLSVLIDRWTQEEERDLRWQGAGSQRITQWLEGGARPLFSILATRRYVEPLRSRELISWTLPLGCSALSLAQAKSDQGAPPSPLTLEEWRAWGEGISSRDRLAFTSEEVPLGRLTRALLSKSEGYFGRDWRHRVQGAVVTQPLSASATATLLMTGEVDATLLFKVMAYGRPGLSFRDLPAPLQTEVTYIAVGVEPKGKATAERFRSWLKANPSFGLTSCAQGGSTPSEGISP